MKKNISFTILLISSLFLIASDLYSQDKALISPYIQLQYFKNTDDHRILKTTLTYSLNRMELPLAGMEIAFYSDVENKNLLGTGITDDKGAVKFELADDLKIATSNDGMWTFNTVFKGNDTIEAASTEIAVKDVTLVVTYTEPDSIKTITVKAYSLIAGKEVPAI